MAFEVPSHIWSAVAGEDLSAAQFKAVKLNSSGQIVLAGAGELAIGILQDKPKEGTAGNVWTFGPISKVLLGGTVAAGARVAANASGQIVTAAAGNQTMGVCLVGGASGTVGSIVLFSGAIPAA